MDFKDKISKRSYLALKDELKANAAVGKSIRQETHNQKGLVRYNMRNLKRAQGEKTRYIHLALCFLRGRKYSEVEPNVSDDKRIYPESGVIQNILRWKIGYKYQKSEQFTDDIYAFFEAERPKVEKTDEKQTGVVKSLLKKVMAS